MCREIEDQEETQTEYDARFEDEACEDAFDRMDARDLERHHTILGSWE